MRLCRREFLHLSAAAPALALVSSSARAQAQEFPARPVRIITHSAPGGSPDALLRIVADRLSQMWGRQVLALNREGKLTDSIVNRFAVREDYTNVVAALSFMTDMKIEAIEPLIRSDRLYALIVACRAARLSWSTTTMIVHNRPGCPPVTQRELEAHEVLKYGR